MNALEPSLLIPYLAKLERRMVWPDEERDAFLSLSVIARDFHGQGTALAEGDPATHCAILLSGFITRQKTTNGSRQIISFCFPGDAVDLQSLWFHHVDHSIVTHGPTRIAYVAHTDIIALCDRYPFIAKMLWHDTMVDAAIFREWTFNIGHRRARPRIAHLLLEIAARLDVIGALRDDTFELPLSQADLASALGLSLVHFNKSLANIRADGLIRLSGRTLHIENRPALERLTAFDTLYLHLKTIPKIEGGSSRKLVPDPLEA